MVKGIPLSRNTLLLTNVTQRRGDKCWALCNLGQFKFYNMTGLKTLPHNFPLMCPSSFRSCMYACVHMSETIVSIKKKKKRLDQGQLSNCGYTAERKRKQVIDVLKE